MEFQRLQGTVSAAALLPLRLFLGVTFLYAGLDKLLDPSFLDPASPSGIQAQLEGFTHVSPLAPLIEAVALPFPVAIGVLMALGEIAVGLGALTGLAYRLAAAGGAVISLTLLLTASWTVRPYYLGNDLPYLLGWVTLAAAGSGGVLVLGPWLERNLGPRLPGAAMRPGVAGVRNDASPSRRLFLEVTVLGVTTLLVGAVTGGLRMLLPTGTTSGTLATPGPTSTPTGGPAAATPAPAGSPAAGNAIANVSDLASTSAIGFTVPSSGRSRGPHQALRRHVRGLRPRLHARGVRGQQLRQPCAVASMSLPWGHIRRRQRCAGRVRASSKAADEVAPQHRLDYGRDHHRRLTAPRTLRSRPARRTRRRPRSPRRRSCRRSARPKSRRRPSRPSSPGRLARSVSATMTRTSSRTPRVVLSSAPRWNWRRMWTGCASCRRRRSAKGAWWVAGDGRVIGPWRRVWLARDVRHVPARGGTREAGDAGATPWAATARPMASTEAAPTAAAVPRR